MKITTIVDNRVTQMVCPYCQSDCAEGVAKVLVDLNFAKDKFQCLDCESAFVVTYLRVAVKPLGD